MEKTIPNILIFNHPLLLALDTLNAYFYQLLFFNYQPGNNLYHQI